MVTFNARKPVLYMTMFASILLGTPSGDAQTIEYTRSSEHVASTSVVEASLDGVYFTYLCHNDSPLCGGHYSDLRFCKYTPTLPTPIKVVAVQPRNSLSNGWHWINGVPHNQRGFCLVVSFDSERVTLKNTVHRVNSQWFPTTSSNATCTYRVLGTPEDGLLQWSGTNGVFGIDDSGNLVRKSWNNGQWNSETILTWGGRPVIGSLVQGDGTGANGKVYGVNEAGEIFNAWNNSGSITYGVIPGTTGFHADSLIFSEGGSLFAAKDGGELAHVSWSGSWQVNVIPHWGGTLVPESLIAGETQDIFGVNKLGQAFTVWDNSGAKTFGLIPGAVDIVPDSLASSDDKGVFAVNDEGSLIRIYWDAGWQTEVIPHWGGKIIADSLVASDTGHVYGINEFGELFLTWDNSGVVTFGIVPGVADIVPNSLAVTANNGVFAIRDDGTLIRTHWSSGGWQIQLIPHWGGRLVPESLIPSETDLVYGLNENGEIFLTWNSGGTIFFVLMP